MAIVYQHIRLDTNSVFYIGIGESDKRAYSRRNRNNHWHNIVNKVGYSIRILHDNMTRLEAIEFEKHLIKEIGRYDLGLGPLVNMTDGGDGGSNPSPETLVKLKKPKPIGFGERVSKALTGKKKTDAHISAMKKPKAVPSWKKGLKGVRSKEDLYKNKMNQKNRREIEQINAVGSVVKVWLSISDAVSQFGSGVSCCLAGYQNTCKGYTWRYATSHAPMKRIGGKQKINK